MKKILIAGLGILSLMSFSTPADAHFMVVYDKNMYMEKAQPLDIHIFFTHPASAGQMMDMGGINEFYAIHQRGDSAPKKIDLKQYLKEITWKSPKSSAPAFEAKIPAKVIRSMGDYTVVLIPGYYIEKEEDVYMQQITKLILNVGGIPGNWNVPVGLPCEIVPLAKPYGLWTGNTFRGQVLSKGKPVANAEVEVEYMGHALNLDTNSFAEKSSVNYTNPTLVTQTIITDPNGIFTFGLAKAGWWGFAALGVGPDTKYKGKGLSQDAVIWVEAVDMK